MFKNRRTSQKPSDDFVQNFKAKFPGLGQAAPSTPSHVAPAATTLAEIHALSAIDDSATQLLDAKCADSAPTPKPSNEPWNFGSSGLTPSFMDPSANNYNMFVHHMPGYYTPTPGGTNTIYHPQAGDLHTPNFNFGMGTPLSMPTSDGTLHAGHQVAAFHGYHPQLHQQLVQHPFQNVNPFQMHHPHGPPPPQQTFAPHQFSHQPNFDQPLGDSPIGDMGMEMDQSLHSQQHSPELLMHPHSFQHAMPHHAFHPTGDKFRFPATLNAPTAMIKSSDEIPITYLNKGQAYTLNVVDTHPQPAAAPVVYRTFVRVSFEDEQQRQKPGACWQLWKEGRGTNEAHQRGGRLQAVEYVETTPVMGTEDPSKPKVELESASFDGFCVTWSPSPGASECPISVRFNFLSTDFSHSKGVKGIPVRLCAKTHVVSDMSPTSQETGSEVCYCKVKLFRDHGAERKLSNDVAHVKKTIDKLNQQIAQIEAGMRDHGKRKRSNSIAKGNLERPGKVAKHRRTWSMASIGSTNGRGSAEDDLHIKLMTLQDMFTSTRPASVLYLRGAEDDDPDIHPVKMSGEQGKIPGEQELVRNDSGDPTAWERQSTQNDNASLDSPTSSSRSLAGSRRDSNLQQPTPFGGISRVNSSEWRSIPQGAVGDLQPEHPQQLASPPDNQPVKVQTRSPKSGTSSSWVNAVGIDPNYQAPPERAVKPVACFYVQNASDDRSKRNTDYYRAIYLMNRTLKDFINAVATKCNIEPTKVSRTVRLTRHGLQVLFEDDCVRELPEGQDMTAEFSEIAGSPSMADYDWDDAGIQCDGDITTLHNISSSSYELKLHF